MPKKKLTLRFILQNVALERCCVCGNEPRNNQAIPTFHLKYLTALRSVKLIFFFKKENCRPICFSAQNEKNLHNIYLSLTKLIQYVLLISVFKYLKKINQINPPIFYEIPQTKLVLPFLIFSLRNGKLHFVLFIERLEYDRTIYFQVCDGNQDCANASDECQPECIKSVFSNEKSMIKNKGMLASVSTLGKDACGTPGIRQSSILTP